MRHRRSKLRLNQKPGHARMLKRNLITSLLLYEKMRTTKKRAAVITPEIDKIITFAKNHTPHVAIRHINTIVTDKNASKKIMEVYIKRFAKVQSGLTRIKAAGSRDGDGAELVDVTLVEGEMVVVPVVEPKKKAPKKEAPKKESPTPKKN